VLSGSYALNLLWNSYESRVWNSHESRASTWFPTKCYNKWILFGAFRDSEDKNKIFREMKRERVDKGGDGVNWTIKNESWVHIHVKPKYDNLDSTHSCKTDVWQSRFLDSKDTCGIFLKKWCDPLEVRQKFTNQRCPYKIQNIDIFSRSTTP
jgi:hypothetical protein